MPTPSMLSNVATTHNWVSSAEISQNILKPEVDPILYRRYGNQNMTGLLEMMGGMNPISALEYSHFEEDFLHSIVKVDAASAGAANAAVTLTVASGYQYTYPSAAQSPYIVAGAATVNPVRLQDTIKFPDGTEGTVTAVTSSTFTVYPSVLGTNIPAVTTATELPIVGNAHQEQTDQPVSRNFRLIEYNNNLQIFKGNHTASGSAMGEQTWVKFTDENGKTANLWYYKGQLDEYNRFKNEREISLLVGQKVTNTTLATAQPTLTKTEGLIPFIENNGNTFQYNGITGITRSDFETMIESQLDKNRGAKENTLWAGIKLRQSIDRFLSAEMKQGGVVYGIFGGNKEQIVNFGFDSFTLSGYTFHLKTYDVFNYPQMLGAAGQPYSNMGLIVPAETGVYSLGPTKTKTNVPSLRLNYLSQAKAGGSYSREMEEWMNGGADGVYTSGVDEVRYQMRSHCGLEGFGANRFVKLINS